MPVWWCKVCGKVIAADDLLVGPGGKQYHAACLANYYDKGAVQVGRAPAPVRSSRKVRILLTAAIGLVIGGGIGILVRPVGETALVGALVGVVIGGIVGQQTQ